MLLTPSALRPPSSLPDATHSLLACGGLAVAVAARVALGGSDVAASMPAATAFACLLFLVARGAGWRPALPRWKSICGGVAGAAVLVGFALQGRGWHVVGPSEAALSLAAWSAVVVCVAVAEEVVLRGVIFASLARWGGPITALLVTSILFALIHVPLYGMGALPLDFAVGLWLGGLRLLGGVAASATAHAIADLAAGWIL